jgi:hypothetical protein
LKEFDILVDFLGSGEPLESCAGARKILVLGGEGTQGHSTQKMNQEDDTINFKLQLDTQFQTMEDLQDAFRQVWKMLHEKEQGSFVKDALTYEIC